MCLGSGSSGNCYWLGTDREAILIDAGINFRALKKALIENRLIDIPIRALLITHDHTDHIRGASMVSASMGCPVFSTKEVHGGMESNYGLQKKISTASKRFLQRDEAFQLPLTEFVVTPFSVPHDSHDNVGYYITWRDEVRFCLVTDCGYVTGDVRKYLAMADHWVVESNHDVEMLMNGSYPYYLKKRVRGEGGHLSNDECADLIRDVWHPEVRHIFLCHLSADNNTPDKAYHAAAQALTAAGATVGYGGVTLLPLPRTDCSAIYNLSGKPSELSKPSQLSELSKLSDPLQLTLDFEE